MAKHRKKANKGYFISFEGGEGSGKSTQMRRLVSWLEGEGVTVVVSKEPGGTEIGRKIREILLNPETKGLTSRSELLLYEADRAQHAEEVLRPALQDGKIIVSDRFADSSTVYQGMSRGLGRKWVETLNHFATEGIQPDIVILLDLPERIGLKRIRSRLKNDVWLGGVRRKVKLDRLDGEKQSFHRLVRRGFLSLARLYPKRFAVLDARKSETELALEIQSLVKAKLKRRDLW